jgi:hypothetical protein
VREFFCIVPVQCPSGPRQRIGKSHSAHHIAEAVADQDRGDVVQPTEVTHCSHGLPQHQSPLPWGWPGMT